MCAIHGMGVWVEGMFILMCAVHRMMELVDGFWKLIDLAAKRQHRWQKGRPAVRGGLRKLRPRACSARSCLMHLHIVEHQYLTSSIITYMLSRHSLVVTFILLSSPAILLSSPAILLSSPARPGIFGVPDQVGHDGNVGKRCPITSGMTM